MMRANLDLARRVLIMAPAGRDAQLAASVLEEAGIASKICETVDEFCAEVERGAAAGVLTEEAMSPQARAPLRRMLGAQPIWGDLPLVVFVTRPATRAAGRRIASALSELGNVTALDRPIFPDTMISTVRASLRARDRQYQARELLVRLEEGVRERDKFLATLSHELRNPLGAIRNGMEVVERLMPRSPAVERPLAIVDRQVSHLARLIDDLLDVSRVTTGKVVLQRRLLDLRTIIAHVIQQLDQACERNRLRLSSWLGPIPLWVQGDPVRIEQIVANLMTNAIKYTPSEGRVEVKAGLDERGVWAKVCDTGVGIEPAMLGSIFDMFAQVDRSLDRSQGGMGIGLTLVRSLVELHGGSVTGSSRGLGQGSEFEVRLPAAQPEALAAPPAVAPRPVAVGAPCHVLLVEDSEDNREMLRELLELDGFRVDVAADGAQGVARALSLRPQIAIVDIGLPMIDGYEVARQVRAALGGKIRLVALTGYGQPEDHARTTEAGFDAHLTKPVDLADLAAALAPASSPA